MQGDDCVLITLHNGDLGKYIVRCMTHLIFSQLSAMCCEWGSLRHASNAAGAAPEPVPGLSTSAGILTFARNAIQIVAIATTCS